MGVCVSIHGLKPFDETLLLVPRALQLGIGCRRGTSPEAVEAAIQRTLSAHNLRMEAVKGVASIDVKADEFLAAAGFKGDFYVIDETSLWSGKTLFDVDRLILSISSMEKPSKERDGALIKFSMLNGEPYAADYLVDGKLYARAQFTKPLTRSVDKDGDMIFETTEIYAENDGSVVVSKEDADAASQNIWGSPVPNPLIYLKAIHIDRNGDTLPDFSEEYMTLGGRRAAWDSDYDGNWNVRYTLYPQEAGKPVVELTEFFVQGAERKVPVSIKLSDGEPQEIKVDSVNVPVTKGRQDCFYWVDGEGSESQELNVIGFMKGVEQGVVSQFDSGDCFLQAVLIGQNIFARAVKKSDEVKRIQKENDIPKKND